MTIFAIKQSSQLQFFLQIQQHLQSTISEFF